MADFTMILNWALNGTSPKNVLAFDNGVESADFAIEAAGSMVNWLVANVLPSLNDGLTLPSITVRFDNSDPMWSFEVPFTGIGGEVDAQTCPGQDAILISTSYAGPRPNRGRVYLPGLTEATCTEGEVSTSTVSDLNDAFGDLVANGLLTIFGNIFLRIARRNSGGIITATNPVEAATCRSNVATIRGRRFGSS